jgi:hypothetical protein
MVEQRVDGSSRLISLIAKEDCMGDYVAHEGLSKGEAVALIY